MLRKDSMRTYMNAIALINIQLHFDVDMDKLLETDANTTAEVLLSNMQVNECSKYLLSKKYTSIEELSIDNNNPLVYFDAEYDTTNYNMLEKYNKEKESMPVTEFLEFLINKLQEENRTSREAAEIEANAIVNGYRSVNDGDYAVVDNYGKEGSIQHYYFKLKKVQEH